MRRLKISSLKILCAIAMAALLFGQKAHAEWPWDEFYHEESVQNDPTESKKTQSQQSQVTPYYLPCPLLFSFRHIEGGGVGYNRGYSTLAGTFYFNRTSKKVWSILDLRAHCFNNAKVAANAGLGIRFLPGISNVFGFNVFYDYRNSSCHLDHHQIGLGFEVLTDKLDFRLNGYMPIETERLCYRCEFFYPGNYYVIRNKVEAALRGGSAEIGKWIKPQANVNAYLAIGAYYFGEDVCRHPFGGKFRLKLNLSPYISLMGNVTYDDVYKTRVQGQLALNFYFGCSSSPKKKNVITQPIERNEIIVLDRYCKWLWNY